MDFSTLSPYYNLFNQIIKHGAYVEVEVLTDGEGEQTVTDKVLIKDVYFADGDLLVKYFSNNFQIILVVPCFYFKSIHAHPIEDFFAADLFKKLIGSGEISPSGEHQEKSTQPPSAPSSPLSIDGSGVGVEGHFVFSVSALTSRLKQMIVKNFYSVWVKGEIHDAKLSTSGHAFFNLRDKNSSLSCVIYSRQLRQLKFKIENGIIFECFGNLTLYEKRGIYQLVVERLSPEGQGDFDLAFKQLKIKLEKEGLFELERKKPIPKYPDRVGIITSIKGAALIDILKTTQTEFHNMELVILPCLVQGERAAESIASMIEYANKESSLGLDLLILTRGGGASEDLWAFNEEITAKAIFNSKLPIISAIGHEVDWTIADLVADFRCPTPTAAARFVCTGKKDLQQEIFLLNNSLQRNLKLILQGIKYRVKQFSLPHLGSFLRTRVDSKRKDIAEYSRRLNFAIEQKISKKGDHLSMIKVRLMALSPQRVFERGYMIVKRSDSLITDLDTLKKDDLIEIVSLSKSKPAKIL